MTPTCTLNRGSGFSPATSLVENHWSSRRTNAKPKNIELRIERDNDHIRLIRPKTNHQANRDSGSIWREPGSIMQMGRILNHVLCEMFFVSLTYGETKGWYVPKVGRIWILLSKGKCVLMWYLVDTFFTIFCNIFVSRGWAKVKVSWAISQIQILNDQI